jgi:hypothetical protein
MKHETQIQILNYLNLGGNSMKLNTSINDIGALLAIVVLIFLVYIVTSIIFLFETQYPEQSIVRVILWVGSFELAGMLLIFVIDNFSKKEDDING